MKLNGAEENNSPHEHSNEHKFSSHNHGRVQLDTLAPLVCEVNTANSSLANNSKNTPKSGLDEMRGRAHCLSFEDALNNQNGGTSGHFLNMGNDCDGNYPMTQPLFVPKVHCKQASCNLDSSHWAQQVNGILGLQGDSDTVNLFPSHRRVLQAVPMGDMLDAIAVSSLVEVGKVIPGLRKDEDHASWVHRTNQESSYVSGPHPAVTIAVASSPSSRSHARALGHQSANPRSNNDRLRHSRISRGVKALQGLVPNSKWGDRAFVLDEVIEYVKFLQLQMKVLSLSRLGGEATIDPLIYLEGYGHFLSNQAMDASLEDMVGSLMESDMTAAMRLLQRKGLCFMPMAFADCHS